ncbi:MULTISPECIES: amidophosphoribosyltransferase [Microbacterium]|uniref:amidophosphoribosyltransferase n=1 Tax=Microbacterium TaxID=33882 RepID=UPI00217DC71F|nr:MULTISPECIES: amidophosphoribosyltransferase [Microbacterium]UWF77686.1 amidophosphoribosyltransferase [Microbacterium neungamense]WCM55855.1 amidophosphoribosyltransferase [Microbacterium sp. EF45047]
MCGIVGMVGNGPVNQDIYDALLLLQHRGQDATGIATAERNGVMHMAKASGMVREAFRTRDMRSLLGSVGLGHVRYATKGTASSEEEMQPFYVNAPYGIVLVHNGNLTNTRELTADMERRDRRHLNSSSDTELLLNVLANELQATTSTVDLDPERIFEAVSRTHKRIEGAYAVISIIAGYGLLAFRDPFGIRPMILGRRKATPVDAGGADASTGSASPATPLHDEWVVSSESLVLENGDYEIVREVEAGEAVFITNDGELFTRQCAEETQLTPCAFEYVYLARPDSVMNGVSVYESRLRMGERLADTIAKHVPLDEIDVVMPIPDSSRPSAMEVARKLGKEYREGFYKNRYVGRTFIMPGQAVRKKSVRQKLNAMSSEFRGKNVLLIDDSIVRGTTSKQIIQMARDAGATSVIFASAAPPVRHPHVYGINMPSRHELVAHGRTIPEIAEELGCDRIVYQEVEDLKAAIIEGSSLTDLDMSCFDGRYVTGTVTDEYLDWVERSQSS